MKRALVVSLVIALCVLGSRAPTIAQSQSAPQKSLSASIDVQVFPSEGQNAQVQSKDEAACYQWAVQNTGTDPFQLSKQAQAQAQASAANAQSTTGSGARGAARGAAGGALIGAIAGNAGKGAAIGAATGFVFHRVRARGAQAEEQERIDARAQYTEKQLVNFKKAFCACLEAKKYIAKY